MRYQGDPFWLTARYVGKCCKCDRVIRKGENIFYYPKGKHIYCDAEACGGAASADFDACAFDESMYTGVW